jgi:hypothetical protein
MAAAARRTIFNNVVLMARAVQGPPKDPEKSMTADN